MSFEFQSTLVNVTPNYRISGNRIGAVRMERIGDLETVRIIVTNDSDLRFSAYGQFELGDPTAIYANLAESLHEVVPGVLINKGAVSSIALGQKKIVIDIEGADRKFNFLASEISPQVAKTADSTWSMPVSAFNALSVSAATWRSGSDDEFGDLSTRIEQLEAQVSTLTALNTGLTSGQLSANSLHVG